MRVSSRQHALVADCRALARGSRDGRVLLDGAHLVAEALRASVPLELVLATAEALTAEPALLPLLQAAAVPLYEATASVLDAASPTRSPSGVVGIARWATVPVADLFLAPRPLVVGLIDVQDPGNVGAVIRAADALGATGVGVAGESADPAGWKALRGSMGSAFRIPVSRSTTADLVESAARARVSVVASVAHDGVDPASVALAASTLILVGHEGAGLSADLVQQADARVTLAMRAGVDSLNVSIAAALLLDEARRQRGGPRPDRGRGQPSRTRA
jgi:TrmH family RNA methyltransferase